MTGLTVNDAVDDLISEYHAVLPPAATMNETDMLLAAVLMELQAQRFNDGVSVPASILIEQRRDEFADGNPDQRATYHTENVDVDETEWTEIELNFVATAVDLRNITGGLKVAFTDPSNDNTQVKYDKSDSPVVGIPVETGKVWLRSQSGAGSHSLDLEAWD